ncbi:hypothetical protein [Falsiroseomonas sp. E2-1-a20]|uniref:hypothetical protein n=1 Tax=Falsiroseomonas sp. E2-1-a20 TaxID=3239300 RepID=UPI003F2B411E
MAGGITHLWGPLTKVQPSRVALRHLPPEQQARRGPLLTLLQPPFFTIIPERLTMPVEKNSRRIGPCVVVRDLDGRPHAISVTAVVAICADVNEGPLLALLDGRT